MNKKIVIPLTTGVAAAVAVGFALFRDKSKRIGGGSKSGPVNDPISKKLGFVTPTFQTKDRKLLDRCGKAIILKGVNKMSVYDFKDPVGTAYFPEIAKTGANCVRIVWEMRSDQGDGKLVANPLSRLDQLITNAKNNCLIPIVGLWDYTNTDDGGFSHLDEYVAYWTRSDVAALVKKHQAYLIVNIANEAATGDEDTPADVTTYAEAYKDAVKTMRQAGILVPLMIDGMDRGKSLKCFELKGLEMLNADPLKNIIFSFHAYWPKSLTDSLGTFIQERFDGVSGLPITIVVGELAGFGAGPTSTACTPAGAVDYVQFYERAEAAGMGWLLWEWGPKLDSNNKPICVLMDMTSDGTYAKVTTSPNQWVRDLAINKPFSLKFAQKTPFVDSGFTSCLAP